MTLPSPDGVMKTDTSTPVVSDTAREGNDEANLLLAHKVLMIFPPLVETVFTASLCRQANIEMSIVRSISWTKEMPINPWKSYYNPFKVSQPMKGWMFFLIQYLCDRGRLGSEGVVDRSCLRRGIR